MKSKKNILIVGAGIASLALYAALDRDRFAVTIIERRQKFERLGYALLLMPLGVQALRLLGFSLAAIHATGIRATKQSLLTPAGKPKLVSDFRPVIKKYGAYMIVSRARLYHLLEKRVPHTAITFGTTVKKLQTLPSGKTRVLFTSGKRQIFDVVVGADGVYSGVRQLLFPQATPQSTGLDVIWAWIRHHAVKLPRNPVTIGDLQGIGFFHSGERDKSCVAFFVKRATVPHGLQPTDYHRFLRNQFHNYGRPVPAVLKNLPPGKDMYMHGDEELTLKTWHRGQVVLMGDAAHARTATSGAGVALALEDALILARELNHGTAILTAIRNYVRMQKQHSDSMAMRNLARFFGNQKGIVDFLMRFHAASPLYRDDFKLHPK